MGRCRVCDQRRDTKRVRRLGGGNHSRMSYWRLASICQECAWFAQFPPVGRDAQMNLWSIDGLRAAWPRPNERN